VIDGMEVDKVDIASKLATIYSFSGLTELKLIQQDKAHDYMEKPPRKIRKQVRKSFKKGFRNLDHNKLNQHGRSSCQIND